ncbi:MAG TPA: hypothetical protein VIS74_00795 [Chthoniobacterales bacterium]
MAKRIFWISLGTLAVLAAAAFLIGYAWIGRYLRSEPFRQLASAKTSGALKVEGAFQPLSWTGASVYSDRFQGAAAPRGYLEKLDANRIRVEVNFRKILNGAWRVDEVNIGHLAATFGAAESLQPAPSAPAEPPASALPGWLPRRFEIGPVNVENADLAARDLALNGAKLTLRPDGTAWVLHGSGGKFRAKSFPELSLHSLTARVTASQLFLTQAAARPASGGNLTATGEMAFASGESEFRLDFTGIQAREVLPPEIAHYLSGLLGGTAILQTAAGSGSTSGNFVLTEGMVKDLPVLQQLAKFTQSPQFERLPLQTMSGDFLDDAKGLDVKNFVAESKGLLRVEGQFHIGNHQELRGHFQVGLTPQTLQWLPGSRERVFTAARDGYLWTAVNLGGTTAAPSEDLSDRLAVAMGQQVIQQGADLLKNSPDKAIDTIKDAVNILAPFTR